MTGSSPPKHEVSFCADVKSWLDALFAKHPEWPFHRAEIEETGHGSRKRSDLKIMDREHRTPVLTGEVKMPGTPEGRNPYSDELMQDAAQKAENLQADYFFTWNVNKFVLFDRSQWKKPVLERRIRDWNLDVALTRPDDCGLPEIQTRIRDKFLPQVFADLAAIVSGRLRDWACGWSIQGSGRGLRWRGPEDVH